VTVPAAATDRHGAIVAIETATETVGVAVRSPAGLTAEFALTGRRRHVETLTPALEHLLAQVGLLPGDLGLVAVDIGPGLFTGLRVGVAAAKGLAQSLDIGILCATSLEILTAAAAAAGHDGAVLACIDARRGEVFASVCSVRGGTPTEERDDPSQLSRISVAIGAGLFAPGDLVSALHRLDGSKVLAVGDGAIRYADTLASVTGVEILTSALSFPPPRALLDLAAARLDAGEAPVSPESVVPLYMREADARSNFERATRS
jgi:tRNA threonylcarbamoyladenosine biosynthesis protein TsaB